MSTPPEPDTFDHELSLAETIRELANQPVGDGRLALRRRRALELAERATTRGTIAPAAEVGWAVSTRFRQVGGSALAALLAYRVFVWMLPLALVSVFVLNLSREEPLDTQKSIDGFGIAGYIGASISQATAAAGGPGLVSGAIAGSLVLLWMTYALVRALRAVHALAWRMRPTRMPRPVGTTLLALVMLLAMVLGRGLVDGLAERIGGLLGFALGLASDLTLPVLWLVFSTWLPSRATGWRELVPGAVCFGVAVSALHVAVSLLLFPYLEQKQATYGALGLAAGIMLALYGLGFAITLSAVLDSELVDRRRAQELPRPAA